MDLLFILCEQTLSVVSFLGHISGNVSNPSLECFSVCEKKKGFF